MENENLEKSIVRLDKDIAALKIAKKYLSNEAEIEKVREELNQKRQLLANELYSRDYIAYDECCEIIGDMLNKNLDKDEQKELLDTIKRVYERQSPNASKGNSGLNAWLKEMDIEYKWIETEDSDWATLIITGFGIHK
ncbi:hypothetical protein [Clostridium ihumii]|uniref:hypothetical protein n=1 Tax=Clostridium ihumii TaxID=1470356 RepID=UPI00058F0D22|nr:hypothetical protein [Clostridium ihumii]